MPWDRFFAAALGPLGVAAAMAGLLVAGWPWLRRARARPRRRAVRMLLAGIVLAGLLGTWAIPRTSAFGVRSLGRHGWVVQVSMAGTVRTRVQGTGLLTSLIESGFMVVIAIVADGLVRQRLAARDAIRCHRCGYDLELITSTRCPECGLDRAARPAPVP